MNAPAHPIHPPHDPHAGQPVMTAGPEPERADLVLLLLHGRGGDAHNMLSVWNALSLPAVAALAPQAAGHTWYPLSFLAPLESNQPFLDSALARVESLVHDLIARGISSRRIALLGFSQGACLALETVLRYPRRYAAVIGLSGGLIGPPGTTWNLSPSLAGMPVFLGAVDPDPHVPFARVEESSQALAAMGAKVDLRRYPSMPHTINQDEVEAVRALLEQAIASNDPKGNA